MKKWIIASAAILALGGTAFGVKAYAQHRADHGFEKRFEKALDLVQYEPRGERGWRNRRPLSADDRAAFLDARIAAIKAGLRLNAEQEKLWAPVEALVRDLGKKWGDRFAARREQMQKIRAEIRDGKEPPAFDPVERLKKRADNMAERATDMKRFAEVAQPLYASLDENQKRRLQTLLPGRHRGMMRHFENRGEGPRGPG
ncbi:MAG TPA: Spy/CpxP family protein refolding chaperone [Xanthobacteraceae bacterium]|nr:Spy/CpxP family protein refolding chaperone [Xanthobacteraceae bacterium]